ncbi:MAG TPA: hypothetical protein VKB96_15460 [Gammaproteobacteria bacterium]|nr:hypothetical protein [Gammaproteobacteria bacterium]
MTRKFTQASNRKLVWENVSFTTFLGTGKYRHTYTAADGLCVTDNYQAWQARHPQAAAELQALLQPPVTAANGASEALVQSQVRLACARRGWKIWRNNRGGMTDDTGRFIRFGLGNESAPLDKLLKSSDLIGWTDTGRFVALEIKAPGWHLTPGDKRGQAQLRWLVAVREAGGIGEFITDEGQINDL